MQRLHRRASCCGVRDRPESQELAIGSCGSAAGFSTRSCWCTASAPTSPASAPWRVDLHRAGYTVYSVSYSCLGSDVEACAQESRAGSRLAARADRIRPCPCGGAQPRGSRTPLGRGKHPHARLAERRHHAGQPAPRHPHRTPCAVAPAGLRKDRQPAQARRPHDRRGQPRTRGGRTVGGHRGGERRGRPSEVRAPASVQERPQRRGALGRAHDADPQHRNARHHPRGAGSSQRGRRRRRDHPARTQSTHILRRSVPRA